MIKQLSLFDDVQYIHDEMHIGSANEDKFVKKTKIQFHNPDNGELIWEGENKVIQPGGGLIARRLFDVPNTITTPSYNTVLNLENTVYAEPSSKNMIYLFCVGTDGCGRENSQVFEVDYRRWIYPESMVPFQYLQLNKDLTPNLRKLYFGRKKIGNFFAYYFKGFDNNPILDEQWVDGTPISNTMYDLAQSNLVEIETVVTLKMSITKDDCRDFFINNSGTTINDARINTISLCTAWAKDIDGEIFYQDIRPVTKLNFPNEPLIDLRKGINITYQVYF